MLNKGALRVRQPLFIHSSSRVFTVSSAVAMELYAIELRTADWRRLVAWYREVLGLRVLVRVEEDRYVLLAAGSARIAIVAARPEELAAAAGVSIDRLIFDTDDFDHAVARIEQHTGQQPAVRTEAEGFRQCAATDPDGRSVRLVAWPQRPGVAGP